MIRDPNTEPIPAPEPGNSLEARIPKGRKLHPDEQNLDYQEGTSDFPHYLQRQEDTSHDDSNIVGEKIIDLALD